MTTKTKTTANGISIYDAAVPAMLRGLSALAQYLNKAEAYARDNKIDPATLVNARLAPDMMTLAQQVQRTSDTAKGALHRLTGKQVPSFADEETTIAQLKERVKKTLDLVHTFKPADFAESAARPVELNFPNLKAKLTGEQFFLSFFIPNFYFHLTTAHDILRNQGLPVGKSDYLGSFDAANV